MDLMGMVGVASGAKKSETEDEAGNDDLPGEGRCLIRD